MVYQKSPVLVCTILREGYKWKDARYAVQDFAESYNLNEEDENRIAVLNRDTGEVSVWELTIQKEYDITEVVA